MVMLTVELHLHKVENAIQTRAPEETVLPRVF